MFHICFVISSLIYVYINMLVAHMYYVYVEESE